jgi:hypothetical protein
VRITSRIKGLLASQSLRLVQVSDFTAQLATDSLAVSSG